MADDSLQRVVSINDSPSERARLAALVRLVEYRRDSALADHRRAVRAFERALRTLAAYDRPKLV